MIWFKENCLIPQQPIGSSIKLIGEYNESKQLFIDSIIIYLEILLEDKKKQIVLYRHNPTMLRAEDPSMDDILTRYHPQIMRIKKRLGNNVYSSLVSK